jgi:hypothetical protein
MTLIRSNDRGCYCALWDSNPEVLEREGLSRGWCGWCNVCGAPGHTRHAPNAPYTAAWCDRCYKLQRTRSMMIGGLFIAVVIGALVVLKACA